MPFYSQAHLRAHPELRTGNLDLGYHPKTHDQLMLPDLERTMGMRFIGKAGSGKSSGMKGLAYQDALKGNAVIVLDPHSDFVDECVAEFPQHRVADTHVLDMADEEFPFGVNLFAMAGKLTTEVERTQAVERIWRIFTVLWPEIQSQQHLPMLLRSAIITFLDNPGSTLVDMLDFFRDDDFRARILSRVHDKSIRDFFRYEYDEQPPHERTRRVQPLMNRLQGLFVGRALPRNILGQRVNSIDFRRAIEQRQIIFIKLPTTTMGEDAKLVGTILMSQISAAIFSFVDTPPEKRPSVSLYVDEVANFTTPDFARLVEEGRKFNVRLTVAHQAIGQFPEYLQRATAGMQNQIIFRVTPEDARALAPLFPPRQAPSTGDEVDAHATKYLTESPPDTYLVRTFVDTYLRPVQHQKSGGQVEIESERTISTLDVVFMTPLKDGKKEPVCVPDPTIHLDHLLYDVMRRRDYLLPIPWDAIAGFANCGGGFYGAVKGLRFIGNAPILSADITFPLHLANRTANGNVWLRKPESDKERLLHCIFHLRMVMRYLAEHPIVKGGKVQTIDYGQILIQLPKRTALVKSGEDVGMVCTNDTPTPLFGEALAARRYFLQEQTRQTYCHPRGQIETLIDATTPPDEATLGRWEHVPNATEVRHPAQGHTGGTSGAVSAATTDGGPAHPPPLPARHP